MPWIDRFTRPVNNQPLTSIEPLRLPRIVPTNDEKRRDTRAELEILVTAITQDGRRFQAYSRDLSQHGSAVIIWGELAIGERVSFSFPIPSNHGGDCGSGHCETFDRTSIWIGIRE